MKNTKRKIASIAMASLMTMTAMSAMTVNVSADWNETESGITYTDSRGTVKKGWQTIDGSRYFFGRDGIMRTGLRKIGGETYYFGKDGKMRTGDVKIKGKVYSFGKDGKLSGTSETVTLSADDVLKKLKKELGDSYAHNHKLFIKNSQIHRRRKTHLRRIFLSKTEMNRYTILIGNIDPVNHNLGKSVLFFHCKLVPPVKRVKNRLGINLFNPAFNG